MSRSHRKLTCTHNSAKPIFLTRHFIRADLYYKCYVSAPNAPALYKTVNHIYQRLCEKDLAIVPAILSNYPVDSLRGNHTLLGTAWNVYNIPSVTVEHGMGLYYENHSADSITLALENFVNLLRR